MGKDKLFLDTDVVLDHLADRQPFAEHAHRLLALAELGQVELCASALTFSHLHYLLRKGRTKGETRDLLVKLKRLVKIAAVTDAEIQSALDSGFVDFEDAIQHFAALSAGGITTLITRNGTDYAASQLPVLSPDEYLAARAKRAGAEPPPPHE